MPNHFPFVTSLWLFQHIHDTNLVILDGSWYLPAMMRDPENEFRKAHIPNAIRFDIDIVKDHNNPLPHMLPTEKKFVQAVENMGISQNSTIVIYDGSGLFSAPRVWWTFKVFGAQNVFILEGGFPKWQSEKRPIETGEQRSPAPQEFVPRFASDKVVNWKQVQDISNSCLYEIVDARGKERFLGIAPDIRPGVRAGHIPHSVNLPFDHLIIDGTLAPKDIIQKEFDALGIDLKKPFIVSCGSGVTASVLALAAYTVSGQLPMLYDGSWSEWGARTDLPIEIGEAKNIL